MQLLVAYSLKISELIFHNPVLSMEELRAGETEIIERMVGCRWVDEVVLNQYYAYETKYRERYYDMNCVTICLWTLYPWGKWFFIYNMDLKSFHRISGGC